MEPKFQSSFIPKGPSSVVTENVSLKRPKSRGGFLGFIAMTVFVLSILSAGGAFGYKLYLKYSINRMSSDLEMVRETLEPNVINELTRLNGRLLLAKDLLNKHRVLTPLFSFLGISTPPTVRFSSFAYNAVANGIEVSMKGEARGYAALALAADVINRSGKFHNPIFSDLTLSEKGDVNFSFKATVDETLLSYQRSIEGLPPPVSPSGGQFETPQATTTMATSSSTTN